MKNTPKTGGLCYVKSAQFVLQNQAYLYCEAVVTNQIDGKPMGHAFVDLCNGSVYDAAADVTIRKDLYYQIGKVREVRKMNAKKLNKTIFKLGHYGSFFDLCYR